MPAVVAVRNTYLVCEEDYRELTSLELKRGVSEAPPYDGSTEASTDEKWFGRQATGSTVASSDDEEEAEFGEVELVAPPLEMKLDRCQTFDSFENLKDWQYDADAVADPAMPKLDRVKTYDVFEDTDRPTPKVEQPAVYSPPVPKVEESGISLMNTLPPHAGQVFFPPVPGVMPLEYALQQFMHEVQPAQHLQPTQPMPQQQLPAVIPNWAPWRGMPPPESFGYASQGTYLPEYGTAKCPVNPEVLENLPEGTGGCPSDPEVVPEPVGLRHQRSVNSPHINRIHWTLPDKFLKSTNKTMVSPTFQLFGADWKLLLAGEAPGKGEASFKAAKGRLTMKLKCEQVAEGTKSLTVMFRFFAGAEDIRGPAMHDFLNDKSLAGLKKKGDPWDLMKHVKDKKVTVGVELWSLDSEDTPPAP
jgi:hypothetical protein